eukprot:COSAG01_NODE_1564_length_9896_cov_4.868837_11_plen_209_part_00
MTPSTVRVLRITLQADVPPLRRPCTGIIASILSGGGDSGSNTILLLLLLQLFILVLFLLLLMAYSILQIQLYLLHVRLRGHLQRLGGRHGQVSHVRYLRLGPRVCTRCRLLLCVYFDVSAEHCYCYSYSNEQGNQDRRRLPRGTSAREHNHGPVTPPVWVAGARAGLAGASVLLCAAALRPRGWLLRVLRAAAAALRECGNSKLAAAY